MFEQQQKSVFTKSHRTTPKSSLFSSALFFLDGNTPIKRAVNVSYVTLIEVVVKTERCDFRYDFYHH